MSQATYEFFCNSFEIYHIVIQMFFWLLLWNTFQKPDRGKRAWIAAGILAVVNIGIGLGMENAGWIRYIVSAVIVLGYCFASRKRDFEKTVFVLLLFYNFHALSFLVSDGIYQYVMDGMFYGLDLESEDFLSRMYSRSIICQVVLFFSYTFVFLFMVEGIRKVAKKPFLMKWQDVLFLSILNIVGGMLAGIVRDLSIVQIEGGIFLMFDERREMIWKIPVMALFIYAGEISACYIYQNYRKLQQERQKHFVEEQQIKAMKRRLEEVEGFYGSIRKIRHEMKNHMTNIKGLVAGEQYGELENYIEKLDETIQTLDYQFYTGNVVTDVIINDKYQKAVKAGIEFQVKFVYEETNTIPVFDIGIILNNLLDNAIEACEKQKQEQRYIHLILKKKNQFLLIEVENSFDGELRWEDGDSIPMTMKQSDLPDILMEHGIGLKNVKDVAERYLGDMSIKIKDKVFKVTVMLQQKNENYENHDKDVV